MSSSHILRTPESRFKNLPDYPFKPNYIMVDNLRMHYVDEGPKDGPIALMLHGEPSWSYLYRFMIKQCVAAGLRVIAPDLIGFGKSDKLTNVADYSYAKHVAWIKSLIDQLSLKDITLVGQDWGSMIGLRLAAENKTLFSGIVIGNGALPTGKQKMPFTFKLWKTFALKFPIFPTGLIIQGASKRWLSRAEIKAYTAPFPNASYQAGCRAFPALVPVTPDDPAAHACQAAWDIYKQWEKPFLTIYGKSDPILGHTQKQFITHIPGAKGLNHQRVYGGHFMQEDSPNAFAQGIIDIAYYQRPT